jgi:hypothetical protein
MSYDRRNAADKKDNSFGLGYYPMPPALAGLGRFMDNLKPQRLVSHQVFPREGIHLLTVKVDHQFSIMLEDMKSLIKHGFTRMQCNEPGTMGLYFQDVPIPVAADSQTAPKMSLEERVTRAKQLGTLAFKNGMMRVPAQDAALRELLKGGEANLIMEKLGPARGTGRTWRRGGRRVALLTHPSRPSPTDS